MQGVDESKVGFMWLKKRGEAGINSHKTPFRGDTQDALLGSYQSGIMHETI